MIEPSPGPEPTGTVCHGVFLVIDDIGVHIAGEPAIGKSELALDLVSRGHRLVADDAPYYEAHDGSLHGRCLAPELGGFLEIRGLGVINVGALYGSDRLCTTSPLHLVIHLIRRGRFDPQDRLGNLEPIPRMFRRLGIDVPEIRLPMGCGRTQAPLVEAAAGNQRLKSLGYDPGADFRDRQQALARRQGPVTTAAIPRTPESRADD